MSIADEGQSNSNYISLYKYDVWNELIGSSVGSNSATYGYNGNGLRTIKTVNGQTTNYLYEYDKVILEEDGQGSETSRNVYGTNLLSRTTAGQTADYMYNGHGDVTALMSTTGSAIGIYYYDASGNITESSGDANKPYAYAGYQYDKETGLYYLNSRMYDATTARFMQEDTYGGNANDPLSLNLYTYCQNEPMMYRDPSGHVTVFGNSVDLTNAQNILGTSGNNFINTTGMSSSQISSMLTSSSVIVGGTGATGGVGGNVNTNGATRLAGADRYETAGQIQNYVNIDNCHDLLYVYPYNEGRMFPLQSKFL